MIISPARAEDAPNEGAGEHQGAAGSLAHQGAHEGSAFPPFDTSNFAPQLIWLALVFTLLYVLMSRVALPRVGKILTTRRTTIDFGPRRLARIAGQSAERRPAQ